MGDILASYAASSYGSFFGEYSWYVFSAIFAIFVPLMLDWRGALKVREIRFYDNIIDVIGYRFKAQYAYDDVSRLELTGRRGVFSRSAMSFAVKYESEPFRSANPKSRELNVDLYTWMTYKVPPSALSGSKPAAVISNPARYNYWTVTWQSSRCT